MLFKDGYIPNHLQAASPSFSDALLPRVQITTEPVGLAVSLADLKAYLRIDGNDDDSLLTGQIQAATAQVEAWTRRHLLNRSLSIWMDQTPPGDRIELPYAPARSIDGVYGYAEDGTETQMAAASYYADIISQPPRVVLNDGSVWPTGDLRNANAFKVTYSTGYGTAESNTIPGGLKEAVKALAAHYYEGRGTQTLAAGFKTISEAPPIIQSLLAPWSIPQFNA